MVVRPELVAQPRLRRASCTYELPRGRAVVSWARGGLCDTNNATGPATPASFSLNVTVPPNTVARVTVPLPARGCGRRAVAEKVSGSQLWPRAGSLPLPLGVSGAGADALPDGVDAVTFDVTSGSYEFSAQ